MAEIRLVNKAKWFLISELSMSEPEAHRYIENRQWIAVFQSDPLPKKLSRLILDLLLLPLPTLLSEVQGGKIMFFILSVRLTAFSFCLRICLPPQALPQILRSSIRPAFPYLLSQQPFHRLPMVFHSLTVYRPATVNYLDSQYLYYRNPDLSGISGSVGGFGSEFFPDLLSHFCSFFQCLIHIFFLLHFLQALRRFSASFKASSRTVLLSCV